MIEFQDHGMIFRFPHLADNAVAAVVFWRLLRSQDVGAPREKLLPWAPGPVPLGVGPMRIEPVDRHADMLPEPMLRRGGVLLPMWQSEALSIRFACYAGSMPFAVTLEAGGVNLVSGAPARAGLHRDPQDYCAFPTLRGIDWVRTGPDTVRQPVPSPIDADLSAEDQLDRSAASGGIRISVTPPTREAFVAWEKNPRHELLYDDELANIGAKGRSFSVCEMEADGRPLDDYDWARTLSTWVTMLDAVAWFHVAKRLPRRLPPMELTYEYRQPWFDHYGTDLQYLCDKHPEEMRVALLNLVALDAGMVEGLEDDILPSNLRWMERGEARH